MRIIKICIFLIFLVSCQNRSVYSTKSNEAYEHFQEGKDLQNKLYHLQAIESLKKALAADSNFAMAALQISGIYQHINKYDSACYYIEKANKLINFTNSYEKLMIARGFALYKENFGLAEAIVDTLFMKYPDVEYVKILLANKKWQQLKLSEARTLYFEILENDPDYILAYNNIGYLYAQDGFFIEAVKYIKKYLQLAPDQLNPYDSLAEMYLYIGKYSEVIKLLEDLIRTHGNLVEANEVLGSSIYDNLIKAYQGLGQYSKCFSLLQEANEKFNSIAAKRVILEERFYLYASLEQPDKMLQVLDESQKIIFSMDNEIKKAQIAIMKSEFAEAMANIKSIQKMREKITYNVLKRQYLYTLASLEGELNYRSGLYEEAANNFETAALVFNEKMNSMFARFKQYKSEGKAGNYSSAIDGLGDILKINPNAPQTLYYISEFYYQNNQRSLANSYLEHFLTLWQNCDQDIPLYIKAKKLQQKLQSDQTS